MIDDVWRASRLFFVWLASGWNVIYVWVCLGATSICDQAKYNCGVNGKHGANERTFITLFSKLIRFFAAVSVCSLEAVKEIS